MSLLYQQNVPQHYYLLDTLVISIIGLVECQEVGIMLTLQTFPNCKLFPRI